MKRVRRIDDRKLFPNIQPIAELLSAEYADWDHYNRSNPLEELLFIICSLQTNEALYASTFAALRKKFPAFSSIRHASIAEVATTIAHGGLSTQKARIIKLVVERLIELFGRPTLRPLRAMNDEQCEAFLTSLPGIGKKTARCVMMYSLGRQVFPVDSNCWRICRRLGWVRPTRPDRSCSSRDMDRIQSGVPPKVRFKLHVNLVSHGRNICLPRSPTCHCCMIRTYCLQIGVMKKIRTPPDEGGL